MGKTITTICLTLFVVAYVLGQGEILDNTWRDLIINVDDNWLKSEKAKEIAENVLLYQKDNGGWPKNIQMHKSITSKKKEALLNEKSKIKNTTTDNCATTQEMIFLIKVHHHHKNDRYISAFCDGIKYLLEAQYPNGGWPQYYPLRDGYYSHVTYNDNSMVDILRVLKMVIDDPDYYKKFLPNGQYHKIKSAFDLGIECILKTQYRQDGILTSWCAQYNAYKLTPAKARTYELPSLSGKESAQIVKLLMSIDDPSEDVIHAIYSAIDWFEKVKIVGLREDRTYDKNKKLTEKIMVSDKNAPDIWARFMELGDNTPFFCDRDGIKKAAIADISNERRIGYAWYSQEPQEILDLFPTWENKITALKKTRRKKIQKPANDSIITVAQNGSGDYTSIQEAIDGSKSFPYKRIIINVKNGVYYEKIKIHDWNSKITLIGEEKENTIITHDDYFDKINSGRNSTFFTATLQIDGDDFYASNLTIKNTAGASNHQALAVGINANRVKIENCNIEGHQDTFYATGEGHCVYIKSCLISGTTDYIFGEATVLFDKCEIRSLANSYITAASTPKGIHFGFVFKDCDITAASNITEVYLGRPWRTYAKTVFINCSMGPHIKDEGWHNWENIEAEDQSYFAEYNIHKNNRVPWSHQLSIEDAKIYTADQILSTTQMTHQKSWHYYEMDK